MVFKNSKQPRWWSERVEKIYQRFRLRNANTRDSNIAYKHSLFISKNQLDERISSNMKKIRLYKRTSWFEIKEISQNFCEQNERKKLKWAFFPSSSAQAVTLIWAKHIVIRICYFCSNFFVLWERHFFFDCVEYCFCAWILVYLAYWITGRRRIRDSGKCVYCTERLLPRVYVRLCCVTYFRVNHTH